MAGISVITTAAPAAIGPYSQGQATASLVFTSGQLGMDPATGQLVGDTAAQTRQALDNVTAILVAAGCTLADVVKTTIYLKDLGDFALVNEIYATYFPSDPPARSCVEVARLPRDARVEIEAIAAVR